MNINIFGSTGKIGSKTLTIIKKYFPSLKVNLLCANENVYKLLNQIKEHKPKYVYLHNLKKYNLLKKHINKKTIIFDYFDLIAYLNNSKSDYSILAISGYKSLNYFESIINNTSFLGLVSKEAIVSAGHLFSKNNINKKTYIYPLDSEHFSIFNFLQNEYNKNKLLNITLTASGGPFFGKKFNSLKNVPFKRATKHPKWNMGYKNSIDSATLVNKCLEIIEAHYLFNIPYNNIDAIIHPESLVHSIIEYKNYIYEMIYFYNNMEIPLFHFLNNKYDKNLLKNKYKINKNNSLSFYEIKNSEFPIYDFFKKIDKTLPSNLIKFNIGNEFAVNLYKKNIINYTDIYDIVVKIVSFDLNYNLNNIKDIIKYHELLEIYINEKFN